MIIKNLKPGDIYLDHLSSSTPVLVLIISVTKEKPRKNLHTAALKAKRVQSEPDEIYEIGFIHRGLIENHICDGDEDIYSSLFFKPIE